MGAGKLHELLDLESYPIDQPDSQGYIELVQRCRQDLVVQGMFDLEGFLRPDACHSSVVEIVPAMQRSSFEHRRLHNIYFLREIPELPDNHPALKQVETVNHTICADQMIDTIVMKVYEYKPLLQFLADAMEKPCLYLMDDPLARANVMAYRHGEALNWHFDRSEFTTTLLLQSPKAGGEFEFRNELRSDDEPNYDGVAKLLVGTDPEKKSLIQRPGTLNVFRGKNTAHRVTPVVGDKERMVAVFSYYEQQGKLFSEEERLGFYGRAG